VIRYAFARTSLRCFCCHCGPHYFLVGITLATSFHTVETVLGTRLRLGYASGRLCRPRAGHAALRPVHPRRTSLPDVATRYQTNFVLSAFASLAIAELSCLLHAHDPARKTSQPSAHRVDQTSMRGSVRHAARWDLLPTQSRH